MANPTNKFLPGGGLNPGTTPVTNFAKQSFNVKDGDGKVIKNIEVDATGRAIYKKTFTAEDVGQKTIAIQFTGDKKYKPGATDNFTMAVSKPNDPASAASAQIGTVNQIVAGPGIYISAPNGQGIVTIATEPLNIGSFGHDLYDIKWTEIVYESKDGVPTLPFGAVGQFTAVGFEGSLMRSRDGFNWVQMAPTTSTYFYGVAAELDADVQGDHLDYVAVGEGGSAGYGYLGNINGEAMTVGQLEDQYGPITSNFNSVSVFYSNYTVRENNQFTGGVTELGIANGYIESLGGVPVVEDDYYNVLTRYKFSDVRLQRSNGKPTLIYSQGAGDQIRLRVRLNNSDVRYTPATPIAGDYPYYFVNPFSNQVIFKGFPNGEYFFTPYVVIAIDGVIVGSGYYTTSYSYVNFNEADLILNIGTAGASGLELGHHNIVVGMGISGPTGFIADFEYNARFTVGP